ncbi:MAG: hypothetical protein HZA93_16900 [Verrucomicrobia bacterium]|nr:hypothetical protein [Verrucomicrobiota bacterium]
MTLTLQQFRRRMGPARRAAAAGTEVLVRDRSGASYVFKAAPARSSMDGARRTKARTFGEIFGHVMGSVKGGPPDLSTNKKYLEDFGRKSMGRG